MLPRYAVKVVAHTHTGKLSKEPAVLYSPTGYWHLYMLDAGFHKVPLLMVINLNNILASYTYAHGNCYHAQ